MVGRTLVPMLAALGGQVRVYVRRDDARFRELGIKVAIGEADDEGRLESALEQVHTLVHLIGGVLPESGVTYDELNYRWTEVALRAAANAGVSRFVYLSFPAADASSPNEYLASKGRAEDSIRASGIEHVIFRCPQMIGPEGRFTSYLRRVRRLPIVPVPGNGGQRLNPVAVEDVTRAIVAADDRGADVQGTWDLGGPEVVTFDELIDVAMGPKRKVHVARLPGFPRALLELYAKDAVADPARTVGHFGLTLTPLREGLKAAGL